MAEKEAKQGKDGKQEKEESSVLAKEEEVFQCAQEISAIAHHARLQAYEAEMRASYAVTLAERAIDESDAVQEIAESLTKTARIVAKMSLNQLISPNSAFTTLLNDEYLDMMNMSESGETSTSKRQSFQQNSTPKKKQKPELHLDLDLTDEHHEHERSDKVCPLVDGISGTKCGQSPSGNLKQSGTSAPNAGSSFEDVDSVHSARSLESSDSLKYVETFPDKMESLESKKAELIRGLDSAETLPIVYEDSYQGPRENRSMPWSEKKSMRKLQRKLKDLEVEDNGEGLDREHKSAGVIGQETTTEDAARSGDLAMDEDSMTDKQ